MRGLSRLADRLPVATTCAAIATALAGFFACPLESLPMQHAFLYGTIATCFGVIATFAWLVFQPTNNKRLMPMFYGLGLLVAVWCLLTLMCLVPKVREGSARTQMTNNGKQIGLAIHAIHNESKRLPVDMRDADGESLLSWRVGLLPYMDQGPLYGQFDRMQAWDSPRNRGLMEKMPNIYASILFPETPSSTPWQGFVGPGTAFEPSIGGLKLARDFPDGTSYTILIIEAKPQVTWPQPADIPYGPNLPLPPLGYEYPRQGDWPFCCPVRGRPRFLACMADCTVRMFGADIPEEHLRALIVRNDGQPTDDRWMDE